LLVWLFLHPDEEYSATDLARRFGVSQPRASREADRLVEAALIEERRAGNLRLLRARTHSVVARPLTDLLAVTFGPSAILGDLLIVAVTAATPRIHSGWWRTARGPGRPRARPTSIASDCAARLVLVPPNDPAQSRCSMLGDRRQIHPLATVH
jgi:DNA-binding transcriptional ArsR family regulator